MELRVEGIWLRVTELSPLGWPYSSVGGFPPEILICRNAVITL